MMPLSAVLEWWKSPRRILKLSVTRVSGSSRRLPRRVLISWLLQRRLAARWLSFWLICLLRWLPLAILAVMSSRSLRITRLRIFRLSSIRMCLMQRVMLRRLMISSLVARTIKNRCQLKNQHLSKSLHPRLTRLHLQCGRPSPRVLMILGRVLPLRSLTHRKLH